MSAKIIVVDDAEQVRVYCARVLRRAGYLVETACLAQEALDILADGPADLLITDIMMPEMDGMELTREVNAQLPDMGVVIMTAYSTLDRAIEAVRAGAQGFLPKPFTSSELLEVVEHALQQIEDARQRARLDAIMPLLDLAKRSLAGTNLEELSAAVLDTAISQTAARGALLLMSDGDEDLFEVVAAQSVPESVDIESHRLWALVDQDQASLLVDGESDQRPELADWLAHCEIGSAISVPLRTARRLVGFLLLVTPQSAADNLNEADRQVASFVASQAASLLDNAYLMQEMEDWNRQLERRVAERTRELREAQERLLRTERLATVGKLGSGIAHELRNPLGVIKNSIYYLRFMLGDKNPRVVKHLDIVDREIEVANDIISGLMSFVRMGDLETTPAAPNSLLRKAIDRAQLPSSVALHLDLAPNLPELCVDENKIKQVFLNLIDNAVQAMPEGGDLYVGTALEESSVRFDFHDTGDGVQPEHRERIFEPLFTTKAKGIGLGLAIVKMLVEAHDGWVALESEPGQGATFSVHLPAASG